MGKKTGYTCLILGLLVLSSTAYANPWKQLHNGTLYVKSSNYGYVLHEAVKRFWNFSSVKYISPYGLESGFTGDDVFFLDIKEVTHYAQGDFGTIFRPFYELQIIQGVKDGRSDKLKRIYRIPIASAGKRESESLGNNVGGCMDPTLMIPTFVKHFNWYANAKLNGGATSKNKNLRRTRGKELVVIKSCTSEQTNTEEKIARHYKHPFKIIGSKEYLNKWLWYDKDYLMYYSILIHSDPNPTTYQYLFDAKTGALLHFRKRAVIQKWPPGLAKAELDKFNGVDFAYKLFGIAVVVIGIPLLILNA